MGAALASLRGRHSARTSVLVPRTAATSSCPVDSSIGRAGRMWMRPLRRKPFIARDASVCQRRHRAPQEDTCAPPKTARSSPWQP